MWNLTIVNQLFSPPFILCLFSLSNKSLSSSSIKKGRKAVCVMLLTASYQNQFVAVFCDVEQDKEIEILDTFSTVCIQSGDINLSEFAKLTLK